MASVRRRPTVVHPFRRSSCHKPLGQLKPKLHVKHPWEGRTKVCINCPGHMTKIAAMSIYGKKTT